VRHDVITPTFARKAIERGDDGLMPVAAGAGGDAGRLSRFAFIQGLREWFDGPIALSGSIANGKAILAAQAMGADLAYIDLDRRPPVGVETGPTDDPADPDVELDPDDKLPWPDPERVAKWWAAQRGGYAPGTRYLIGKPITPESLAEIRRMFVDAQERAQRERDVAAPQSPEARTEQAKKDALRRAERIKLLEAELARLRPHGTFDQLHRRQRNHHHQRSQARRRPESGAAGHAERREYAAERCVSSRARTTTSG